MAYQPDRELERADGNRCPPPLHNPNPSLDEPADSLVARQTACHRTTADPHLGGPVPDNVALVLPEEAVQQSLAGWSRESAHQFVGFQTVAEPKGLATRGRHSRSASRVRRSADGQRE